MCEKKHVWKSQQGYYSSLNTALTMFVGIVALRYQLYTTHGELITECHNFQKHSQSPLTNTIVLTIKFLIPIQYRISYANYMPRNAKGLTIDLVTQPMKRIDLDLYV